MASILRKFIAAILFFFAVVQTSGAAYRYNSHTGTRDYCATIRNVGGTVTNSQCEPVWVSEDALTDQGDYFLLRAGLASGGYVTATTSDTVISTSYSLIEKEIAADAAFQTGTLANGVDGQVLSISITAVASGDTFTLTPATATGFTSIVFEAVGDRATLLYVDDDVGWILISQESVQTVN